MTKPISRKMAVDAILFRLATTRTFLRPTADGYGVNIICPICGEPLLPGQIIQFDHVWADVHGGEHDFKNLRPVHYDPCHKKKTKADVQANAKVKRIQKGGRKRRGPKLKSKPFQKTKRKLPTRKLNG